MLRRMPVTLGEPLIVSDTVGFIRDLPHELIAAFRSTLEQTREADLLLHVVDAANPERRDQMREVDAVLDEIGAGDIPVMTVYNKIDQIPGREPAIENDAAGQPVKAYVSAISGSGLEALRDALARRCRPDVRFARVEIPASAGRLRSEIYQLGHVETETLTPDGNLTLEVTASQRDLERAAEHAGTSLRKLRVSNDRGFGVQDPKRTDDRYDEGGCKADSTVGGSTGRGAADRITAHIRQDIN